MGCELIKMKTISLSNNVTLLFVSFGELAFFQLILIFVLSLGELGLRQVIISIKDDNYFLRISFEMFILKIIVSSVLLLLIFLLVSFGGLEESYLIFVVVLIFLPLDIFQYYFERSLRNDVVRIIYIEYIKSIFVLWKL